MSIPLIRRFRPGDADGVWALHVRAIADSGGEAPDAFFSALRAVESVFLAAGGEFLVAVADGGRIIGMGGFVPISAERAELKGMRVHPEHRRRGIATRILSRLERAAGRSGYTVLQLETALNQHAARRLYEARGYVETGSRIQGEIESVSYEKSPLSTNG